jgi:hypothetical protein
VGIIIKGRLKDCGPIENLLTPKIKSFEICIKGLPIETVNNLSERGLLVIQRGEESFIRVEEVSGNDLLHDLLKKGGELISFIPRKETLEDLYLSQIKSIEK